MIPVEGVLYLVVSTGFEVVLNVTCGIAFKTSYGVIQQVMFYSPIESADNPDCLQTNLQRGRELSNYYKY